MATLVYSAELEVKLRSHSAMRKSSVTLSVTKFHEIHGLNLDLVRGRQNCTRATPTIKIYHEGLHKGTQIGPQTDRKPAQPTRVTLLTPSRPCFPNKSASNTRGRRPRSPSITKGCTNAPRKALTGITTNPTNLYDTTDSL